MPPIRVDPELRGRLAELAAGRPIVIDHFASRRCGLTIGDLRVRIGHDLGDTPADELESIDGVRVVVERDVRSLLEGGSEIRAAGPAFAKRLAIDLDLPETWIDFLHSHPHTRR